MLELVFVIVIMGILAKFGTDLFLQTYENYTRSMMVNDLDSKSEAAIQQIANRMSYRIKDSMIAGTDANGAFNALENANTTDSVVEWINLDIERWNNGDYSGIVDLNNANTNTAQLYSPGTTAVANGAAIIFTGANVNVRNGFGWHGNASNNLHDVNITTANILNLATPFNAGDDIFEYYKVAESASALVYNTADRTITYYSDYQPWKGEVYTSNSAGDLLVDNVSTVSVQKVGDVILVVLCLSNNDFMGEGEYSVCKTKTVF